MNLSNLKPAEGSVKNQGKRVGRGQGSGKGGTATRGHKGAKSRSGYSRKIGFEGCLLYTSPSPRDRTRSRMPSSA